ncbi:uncharacterized protein [Palaemon carinicauda]|uniref:uncharacterized protein isoform X4 n=1 Tax=Palaemon carinicauda TaxID=392227 RepID=UPI0035B673F7
MTSKMYDAVRQALGTSRFVATGQVGGGCINEGEVDHGKGEGDVRRRVQKSEGHEINGDSDGPHSAHSRRRPHGRSRAVLGIPGHGAVRIGPRECLGSSWQSEGDVRRRVRKSEGHESNGDSDGPHSAHSRRRPRGQSRAVLGIPGHAQFESAHGNAREAAGRV